MSQTVTIIITDPIHASAIALSLRRFLLQRTSARFVFDDNGVGSEAEPRQLTAEFGQNVKRQTPKATLLT